MDAPVFLPDMLRTLCKNREFNFDEHAPEMKKRGWLETEHNPKTACNKGMRHPVMVPSGMKKKCYVFTKLFVEEVSL